MSLQVLATGPLASFQDEGRPGLAVIGVTRSGAADRGAYRLGGRLVGNSAGLPAIEVTLGGLVVRATSTVLFALTGADTRASVDGFPVAANGPSYLRPGQTLSLGVPPTGLRSYLSVAGGFEVDAVLGSAATDQLSGLGPPALRPGDLLRVGPAYLQPTIEVAFEPSRPDVLEVLPGPRADWFAEGQLAGPWAVGPDSNRVGVRLEGPPISRTALASDRELASEPMVRGSIQVPADGLPVVFGADHPVTGGYPVIGVLTAASSDLLAQCRPGTRVRLRAATGRRR